MILPTLKEYKIAIIGLQSDQLNISEVLPVYVALRTHLTKAIANNVTKKAEKILQTFLQTLVYYLSQRFQYIYNIELSKFNVNFGVATFLNPEKSYYLNSVLHEIKILKPFILTFFEKESKTTQDFSKLSKDCDFESDDSEETESEVKL